MITINKVKASVKNEMQQNIKAELEQQIQACTTQLQELLSAVEQRIWSEAEIAFTQMIIAICTIAIAQVRLPEQLEKATESRRLDLTTNLGLNQQLEEKTKLLDTVVNSTPDGLYLVDRNRRFIYVNRTILQLLRREEVEVLGKTGEELGILPETMIPHNARLERVFINAEPLTEEINYIHSKTGNKYYANYSLTPIFRDNGQVEKVLVTHRDITELRLTKAALDKSNERFAKAFHGSPIASSISTYPEANFLDVNTSWLRVFGYNREDVIGRTTLELGIWDSLERRAIAVQQLQKSGAIHNLEVRFCTKSGEVRDGLVNMEVIELNGECSILAMLIDITDRKGAEVALKQSEQKYRNLVETCQGIIWTVDLQGRYTFVNQAVRKAYGYGVQEMIGHHFSEFMTSNQAQINQETFVRVLQGVSLFHYESQFIHKDGRLLYLSSNMIALRDDVGKVLGATGTTLDITPFKQTEAALRASQAKLSTILDSAIAVIINLRVFADQDWEYDYFSSGAEIMYGYTPEELIADKNLWLSRVLSEDVEMILKVAFENIFVEHTTHIEYRFRHKNGTVQWNSFTMFSKRDEAANCWVVTKVDTDINERKLVEEKLKVSVQEKEALLKEVHHRVKNNLQVISSLLDFQAQHIKEPRALESFQASQNRVKSIALIHEKLYQSESFAQVNLAEYIHNLTTHLIQTYTLNPDNIALQFRLDEVFCSLDIAVPCGLLINELVSNALKHGLPGNSQGTIWVELHLLAMDSEFNQPQFWIIVGNDGIKLSELPSMSSLESVGFQLIYALIQQLHGKLEFDTSRGTEFKISFLNP
jgi:PAS domain S-box-containing protein